MIQEKIPIIFILIFLLSSFVSASVTISSDVHVQAVDDCDWQFTEIYSFYTNITLTNDYFFDGQYPADKYECGMIGLRYFPGNAVPEGSEQYNDTYPSGGGGGLNDVYDQVISGGSIGSVLESYNPETYKMLLEQWSITWSGAHFNSLPSNLFRVFVLVIEYLFKQPASFIPMEVQL